MAFVEFTLQWAKGIPEADGAGKNDLYAVITYGGQKVKTGIAKDGAIVGYRYSWTQTFSLEYKSSDNDIEVKLYDKDFGHDDFIGEAKFSLTKAKASGVAEETVNVVTKTREVHGEAHARIVYKQT